MKFEYDKTLKDTCEPTAWLFYMEDESNMKCLCISTTHPDCYIWMYEDGDITVQNQSPDGKYIKAFYEGDTINITF